MLVHDFRETEAFFGPADTTDMYNWSQFLIDNSDDLDKYTKVMREAEASVLQRANEAAGLAPVMKLKQMRKMLVVKGDKGKLYRGCRLLVIRKTVILPFPYLHLVSVTWQEKEIMLTLFVRGLCH